MSNREAMEIVLEAARAYGQRSVEDCDKIFEATYQMEDYKNDVMRDHSPSMMDAMDVPREIEE